MEYLGMPTFYLGRLEGHLQNLFRKNIRPLICDIFHSGLEIFRNLYSLYFKGLQEISSTIFCRRTCFSNSLRPRVFSAVEFWST